MRECAFCSHTANLSAEHVVSQWIGNLLPGKKTARLKSPSGKTREWVTPTLDWTARVVCETCNNTWMSEIEDKHAKPAMTPLILGVENTTIDKARAHSLSLFAFKTSVVLDHIQRTKEPFFSRRIRYGFREHLVLPMNTIQMWMGSSSRKNGIFVDSRHLRGELTPGYKLHLHVCTFRVGHFVFQTVAPKQIGLQSFAPVPGYEDLSKLFWPYEPPEFSWPFQGIIQNKAELVGFSSRWDRVAAVD